MPHLSADQAFQIAAQQHEAGNLAQAEAIYRQILSAQPDHANSLHLLGVIARQSGYLDEAVQLIGRSIQINPNFAESYTNLAAALQDLGQLDEAIAANCKAIQLNPHLPQAHNNLGSASQKKGLIDEAIAAYRQAIALSPQTAELFYNLATALQENRQLPEAHAALQQAIQLQPHYALAHYALAQLFLLQANFSQAWPEWEWRLDEKTYQPLLRNEAFKQLRWDGSPLNGRTLLLQTEAGFGDTLQFIRYVKMLAGQNGKILLRCSPPLERLLQCVEGIDQLFVWDDLLPPFDVYLTMLSLPALMQTKLESIPATVPYLHADPHDVEQWRTRLMSNQNNLKVGLCWAGGPDPRDRSIPLAALAPLREIPGVTFYSLQVGAAAKELTDVCSGISVVDLTQHLHDFADTAALIANLDLVISVDTAVLHLAGAMGKPAFALLKFMADCRWMLDRTDSPWYPTLRLFRQPSRGDWNSAVSTMVDELKTFTSRCRGNGP